MSISSKLFIGRSLDGSCPLTGGGAGGATGNIITGEVVNVIDNDTNPVTAGQPILSTQFNGNYILLVSASSNEGARSTFAVSSGTEGAAGFINRTSAAPASTNETIDAVWFGSDRVRLYHDVARTGASGAFIPYNITLISN